MHRASRFSIALFAAGLSLPFASALPSHAEQRAPSVTVATATTGELRELATVTGSFVAREEVQVTPEIEGLQIVEILVEEGDTVTAGQVLARLNREALDVLLAQNSAQIARAEAAIAGARASVQEATANRNLAAEQLSRTQSLQRTGVATNDQLDQRLTASRAADARLVSAQNQLRVSEADLVLAREQRRDIELRIARSEIRARIGGVVSRRAARLGAVASAVGDPMFRIIAEGRVELEAEVAETTLARLAPNQKAVLEANAVDGTLPGTVRLVAPEVTRTNRLGRVRIAIDGPQRPAIGTFGRAVVEIRRVTGVIVPLSAIFFAPNVSTVQVVKNGVVETRTVVAGLRGDGRVEIRQGLSAGEQVVSIAGTFVRNGDRVNAVVAPSN